MKADHPMSFLDETLRVDTNASVLSPGDAFPNSLLFNNTTTPDGGDTGTCDLCHAPLPFTHHLALTTHALKRHLLHAKLPDRLDLASAKARLHHLAAALMHANQELASAKYGGEGGGKQEELRRRVLMLISQMKHRISHEYIP